GIAQVREAASGIAVGIPLNHQAPLVQARFHPQGRLVLTAGADGNARLWDWQTGRETIPALKHGKKLTWAELDRSGSRIATASSDGTARVWNVSDGLP